MREPTCEGMIASQETVEKMSENKVNDDLNALPLKVKATFLALAIAFRDQNHDMDDWECDVEDIILPILTK